MPLRVMNKLSRPEGLSASPLGAEHGAPNVPEIRPNTTFIMLAAALAHKQHGTLDMPLHSYRAACDRFRPLS